MNISTLKSYLKGSDKIQELKDAIKDEVNEYSELALKRGSSIPTIYVIDDDILEVTEYDIVKLCDSYVSENLSESEISYISDVLQLSSSVTIGNDNLKSYIFEMSDPAVNGPFTKERAEGIKQILLK